MDAASFDNNCHLKQLNKRSDSRTCMSSAIFLHCLRVHILCNLWQSMVSHSDVQPGTPKWDLIFRCFLMWKVALQIHKPSRTFSNWDVSFGLSEWIMSASVEELRHLKIENNCLATWLQLCSAIASTLKTAGVARKATSWNSRWLERKRQVSLHITRQKSMVMQFFP